MQKALCHLHHTILKHPKGASGQQKTFSTSPQVFTLREEQLY